VLGGGFIGAILDSILGASIQAQYRCALSGRLTERPATQGVRNALQRGFAWVGNDAVNFLSSASVALGAAFLWKALA
jgi:uncharacterized membrane protein